jgi:hypothetical protein
MPNANTYKFMKSYSEKRPKATLFADMFDLQRFDTEKVTVDIERSGGEIAVAVTDLSDDGRVVVLDQFTNKEYTPPIYKEKSPISVFKSQQRQFGANPYDNPNAVAYAIKEVQRNMANLEARQRDAYEAQAASVMQTGAATLVDENGSSLFTISYSPKASHFPVAGTTAGYGGLWGGGSETVIADMNKITNQIHTDGKMKCTDAFFGETAWSAFMAELAVAGGTFDIRRVDQGSVSPFRTIGGANLHGELVLTNTKLRLWTYDAQYQDIQTSAWTKFLDPKKVVFTTNNRAATKTAAFGLVPKFTLSDSRIQRYVPARNMTGDGMSFFIDGATDQFGDNLYVRLSSRGLYIPTAIDTFGCLTATA